MRLFAILWVLLLFLGIWGWIGNLGYVATNPADWEDGSYTLRVVGIPFAPVGTMMYWFF